MRKILAIMAMALFLAGPAWAEPFLVCDPAPASDQITDSKVILDGVDYGWQTYQEVTVDGTTYAVLADLEGLTDGQHTAQAQFRNLWGESSVAPDPPFAFTKSVPGVGSLFVIVRTDR